MSSQKGNVSRSRAQKHQNSFAYRNDKYGATVTVKKAKSKIHDGLCQRCKEVLEWKVKYNKYKPLTQARKCVKCCQKTVKDAYHVMCRPCALQLELCAKCGKKEDIVIPIDSEEPTEEEEQEADCGQKRRSRRRRKDTDALDSDDDDDDDDDFGSDEEEDDDPKKTSSKTGTLPDMTNLNVKE